jgi:hypothetical protein
LPLCEPFFFPNSIAREPGYDINARLKELQTEIDWQSSKFAYPDGEAYLEARRRKEKDDVALACIRRLQQAIRDQQRTHEPGPLPNTTRREP